MTNITMADVERWRKASQWDEGPHHRNHVLYTKSKRLFVWHECTNPGCNPSEGWVDRFADQTATPSAYPNWLTMDHAGYEIIEAINIAKHGTSMIASDFTLDEIHAAQELINGA